MHSSRSWRDHQQTRTWHTIAIKKGPIECKQRRWKFFFTGRLLIQSIYSAAITNNYEAHYLIPNGQTVLQSYWDHAPNSLHSKELERWLDISETNKYKKNVQLINTNIQPNFVLCVEAISNSTRRTKCKSFIFWLSLYHSKYKCICKSPTTIAFLYHSKYRFAFLAGVLNNSQTV